MSVSIQLQNGDSVIAWQTTQGVYFQEFDGNGLPIGSATTVESGPTAWLSLAARSNGGFSVIWDASSSSPATAQVYSASGVPTGSLHTLTKAPHEAQMASTTLDTPVESGSQSQPSWTTLLPNGDTVIATGQNTEGQLSLDIP